MSATIVSPRLMLVGGGSVQEVAGVLAKFGLSRPLVVTDPYMVRSGLVCRCLDPLEAAGIAAAVFSDTVPEPTDTVINAGAALLQAGLYDCLIGFGGGSPIDTAKAMSILAHGRASGTGSHMRDFKVPVQADAAGLPVIAIPTTAGTGSEATRFTVITDTERGEKMLIAGMGALPLAAVVDYELTFTVPKRITADTGVDSLTHALEAYVSRRANPYSDTQALAAMRLIGANLRTAYAEPDNARAAGSDDARRHAGRDRFHQQLSGAGARHVAADRRRLPCAARPFERHAAAGCHAVRVGGGAGALRRGRPAYRLCRSGRRRRGCG